MKKSSRHFDVFWNWLLKIYLNREFENLGGDGRFTVEMGEQGGKIIPISSGNKWPFQKDDALRTWDRFWGLKQTEDYLLKKLKLTKPKFSPYLMASSYVDPTDVSKPLVQNWLDCPNRQACPYIAALIRDYLIWKNN